MSPAIDLDAYARRIRYEGDRSPTLGTLRELVARHTAAIPFENLDPWLKRPVPIDLPALERKLVREGRGGYCFEQNRLFRGVLEALGFAVTTLAARVRWNAPEGLVTPKTHILLRVEVEGEPHLVDVGFGGQTPTGPLRLVADTEQATPHEPYRLLRDGDGFLLQSRVRDEWRSLYAFELRPHQDVDDRLANWYVSTHPDSLFVNLLVAARVAPGRRYALRGRELAVHHLDGETEHRVLASPADLRAALEATFGLRLPEDPGLEAALASLAASATDP